MYVRMLAGKNDYPGVVLGMHFQFPVVDCKSKDDSLV